MVKIKFDHCTHVDLYNIYCAQVLNKPRKKYSQRVENYVRDQMQDYYERLDNMEHIK